MNRPCGADRKECGMAEKTYFKKMLDQSKFTLCILLSEFARQIELAKLCTFETFSFQVYGFRNNCLVTLFFMLSIQVTLCVKKLSLNIDLWFSQAMNSHWCEVCLRSKFDVTHKLWAITTFLRSLVAINEYVTVIWEREINFQRFQKIPLQWKIHTQTH